MKDLSPKYRRLLLGAVAIAVSTKVIADTPIVIDFTADGELGRVEAPFTSADSSLVHFSSLGMNSSRPSLPLSVVVETASGVNDGATVGVGLTSDNFLFDNELLIEFDVPVSFLSLDFGNDDDKDLPPPGPDGDLVPGVDLAKLTVFNGMTQVGQAATVVNGNNLMDQSVSICGLVFDRAVFSYTRPSGDLIIGLTEVVDNVTFIVAQSTQAQFEAVIDDLHDIVSGDPGTPLADKLEDAIAKLQAALEELAKTPPDNQAAMGAIEGAVGDLEATVNDGILDPVQGTQLMDQLAGAGRQSAADAIDQATDQGGDPNKIAEAQQALVEGDVLRASEAFKDAVNRYKDALAKAESAIP